ncbi:MAG: hypothetical protein IJY09_06805 [Lachnospiraceae bacterium]|nr:hypothetical protein [Lachnospiraceae bacterium]
MAEIQMQILQKYGIDIDKVNLFKLYRIKDANLTPGQLEEKIADCRKRWNQSINGANEKFAERDQAHLEKADTYEALLRNTQIRNALFSYYNRATDSAGSTTVAKKFFDMRAMVGRIKKKDVEFFLSCYPEERKNKKAILEMLEKEYKVKGLGKVEQETEEAEPEGKKKDNSPLVTNNFQKATILKISKCESFLKKAAESNSLRQRYPELGSSAYNFLELNETVQVRELKAYVQQKREEVFTLRQEKGQEFAVLVDFYNAIAELLEYRDVVDNWKEFKLIIRYSKLNPYMYGLGEIKPAALEKLYQLASEEYRFAGQEDFVLNYFQYVYDNFNIRSSALKKIIRKARTKTAKSRVLDSIDEKLGIHRRTKLSVGAMAVYYLAYFPIFLSYFVFELVKTIFVHVKFLTLLIGLFFLGAEVVTQIRAENLSGFVEWAQWFIAISAALGLDVWFLLEFGKVMNSYCDWIGIERTFRGILEALYAKTELQYKERPKTFFVKKSLKLVANVLNIVAIILLIQVIIK